MNTNALDDLLPYLAGVTIEHVELTGGGVRIWAAPRARRASCHRCGQPSAKVHSRYARTLADAAIARPAGAGPAADPPVVLPPPRLPRCAPLPSRSAA